MKFYQGLLFAALFLVCACGNDSGSDSLQDEDLSSSSATVNQSSDSKSDRGKEKSSSSVDRSNMPFDDSSDSVASSSSFTPKETLESEITVNEKCSEVGVCDAMVKDDVSTWHFIRKDAFDNDAEYIYKVDGRDLIVTIKNADGTTDSKTYSMYNMESEAGAEMAFRAARATCEDGGGNEHTIKSCVKDTVRTMPTCNKDVEGYIGLDGSVYRICKSGEWVNASNMEIDTYGKECIEGRVLQGKADTSNAYICDEGVFRIATDLERDTDGQECVEGRVFRGNVNKTKAYTCTNGKFRLATDYELDTEGQKCVEGALVWGKINTSRAYTCDGGKFRLATTIEIDTEGEVCIDERVVSGKINVDSVYVCDGDRFRLASSIEKAFGAMCTAKVEGRVAKDDAGDTYYCTKSTWINIMDWSWDIPKEARLNPEIKYGTVTDDRDGQVYKTVQIGRQLWLAENMNYDFPGDDKSSWSIYSWSSKNDLGGQYYTHGGALCACPFGWHLPDTNEWKELFDFVGGQEVAGVVLRSQTGWKEWYDKDFRFGTDAVGFSAIGAGYYSKAIDHSGYKAFFWGLDSIKEDVFAGVEMQSYYEAANIVGLGAFSRYSVRCIKGFYWDSTVVAGKMTDPRDGKVYRTVKIGNQEWMAENLMYTDTVRTPSLRNLNYYSWNDPENDLDVTIYSWMAAIDTVALYNNGKGIVCSSKIECNLPSKVQGICPEGWRLPNKEDWDNLILAAGDSVAGWVLKAANGWKHLGSGINGLGFSAKSADYNELGHYWSATEDDSENSYAILFRNDRRNVVVHGNPKAYRYPVRCLRDL